VAKWFRVSRMPVNRWAAGAGRRQQYRPGLLDGFLAKTGLDFAPFRNLHN
jgi:hypothetical protein